MIYRHTDEQIQEYFNSGAINQSSLKTIIDPNGGIEKFVAQQEELLRSEEGFYEDKKHFIIGKAVDVAITQGNEIFKNKYHYTNLKKKPSPVVMAIVKEVFYMVTQHTPIAELLPFVSYKREIWEVANSIKNEKGLIGYSMNRAAPTEKQLKENPLIIDWWNYDNRWSSMKFAQEYWDDLILADGKQVLADDEYNTINNIVLSFTTHKFTKDLFTDQANRDIVYQFPIYWTIQNVPCKGLLDHLIVDHIAQRIKLIDEKTIGDYITKFGNATRVRRYDLQGSWYKYGLEMNLDKLSELLGKDVTNYIVSNLAFVAESTIKPGVPLVFPLSNELDHIGRFGDGKYTKGWEHGFATYKEWKDINFSVEEKYKATNGVVWIGSDYNLI